MSFSRAKSWVWILVYQGTVWGCGIQLIAEDKPESGPGKDDSKTEEEPAPVVSSHSKTIAGTVLKYHTTAG